MRCFSVTSRYLGIKPICGICFERGNPGAWSVASFYAGTSEGTFTYCEFKR